MFDIFHKKHFLDGVKAEKKRIIKLIEQEISKQLDIDSYNYTAKIILSRLERDNN